MEHNPVGWFEIYVQDMERARTFYEVVLGLELIPLPVPDIEMFGFPLEPSAPGTSGAILHVPGVPSGGTGVTVYFRCEDCAVEEGRVEAAGGTVVRPKTGIGQYGFSTIIKDPDGNMIGLHSHQ